MKFLRKESKTFNIPNFTHRDARRINEAPELLVSYVYSSLLTQERKHLVENKICLAAWKCSLDTLLCGSHSTVTVVGYLIRSVQSERWGTVLDTLLTQTLTQVA